MNQKRFIKTKYHKSVYEHRLFLYDIGVITEDDVYAWFYDLVWRQNNNLVLKQTIKGSVWDYDYSGRWNKRRPFGYQVRKRLRGILVELENPVMLTLTIDSKKVFKEMSNNTNLDVVMYSISKIGEWIRKFNQAYYQFESMEIESHELSEIQNINDPVEGTIEENTEIVKEVDGRIVFDLKKAFQNDLKKGCRDQ